MERFENAGKIFCMQITRRLKQKRYVEQSLSLSPRAREPGRPQRTEKRGTFYKLF